jgi:hypothetical protein
MKTAKYGKVDLVHKGWFWQKWASCLPLVLVKYGVLCSRLSKSLKEVSLKCVLMVKNESRSAEFTGNDVLVK